MRRNSNLIDVFLQPGEHFVGDANYRIRTLLGSCVSITLWHPERKIGAMSHFLLSSRTPVDEISRELDGRYAEESLRLMLQELMRLHITPTECEGKIFGGGNMFPGQTRAAPRNIGQINGETARALLRMHRIRVVSESLFGIGHRQVFFDISNGEVWARQIKPSENVVLNLKESV